MSQIPEPKEASPTGINPRAPRNDGPQHWAFEAQPRTFLGGFPQKKAGLLQLLVRVQNA
jgi:hypothetical protein